MSYGENEILWTLMGFMKRCYYVWIFFLLYPTSNEKSDENEIIIQGLGLFVLLRNELSHS